jgi:hypothetical protein
MLRFRGILPLLVLAAACGQGGEGAAAIEAPQTESCRECHRRLHPGLVADDEASPHRNIELDCEDCHGTDHDLIFAVKGDVPPTVCARCHMEAYQAFARSRHGKRLREGKLDALLDPLMPATGGCTATGGCHNIQRVYSDGSVGRCGACHITHAFRNKEARDPRVCIHCHEGTDMPEYRTWLRSAHSLPALKGTGHVADCVECHGTHDISDAIVRGVPPVQDEKAVTSVPMAVPEQFEKARGVMMKRCLKCHGSRFARPPLELADRWRSRGAQMLDEAQRIVRALHADGLLDPPPKERLKNPVAGHALALGGAQIFDETTSLPERIYYEMHFHHYPALWRGAYHIDPERMPWEANDDLKSALDRLRAIDRELRRAERKPKGDQ